MRGILLAGLVGGCSSPAAPPREEPPPPVDDSPPAVFQSLWDGFDQRYSFFVVKEVDWDALGRKWRSEVTASTTDGELFDAMSGMMEELRDGHLSLTGNGRTWRWTGWYDAHPERFDRDLVTRDYLGSMRLTSHLVYGRLTADEAIGYVLVPSFGGSGWGDEIEEVLGDLEGIRALVIDIRSNGGGNDQNGREIAARFADRRRLFRIVRWREGPEHDDFGDPIEDYIEPAGAVRFDGPVAVLTNRRVYSSAEGFLLMMRALPHVVTVGDTTGGGSANPETRSLPNGWTYRVSRWLVRTPEGETFEGVGLGPDVPVLETVEATDPILERAIAELTDRLTP